MELAVLVGREFQRREMLGQVRHLRRWFEAVRDGKATAPDFRASVGVGHWSFAFVEQWAGILRVPGYEERYPVGTHLACPSCGFAKVYVGVQFPGGALFQCLNKDGCGGSWLVLDGDQEPGWAG